MDQKTFWKTIDDANKAAKSKDRESHQCVMIDVLSQYSLEDILDWELIKEGYMQITCRQDLRAASAALGACYTDEGFHGFRAWLISRGKDVFVNALLNLETLADAVIPGEDLNFEPFSSVAYFAYEARLLHMGMDKNVLRDLYSDLKGRTLDAQTRENMRKELPVKTDIADGWETTDLPALFPQICSTRQIQIQQPLTRQERIENLISSEDQVLAYVYEDGHRDCYLFHGTPENIAHFIGVRPFVDNIVITDPLDRLVLNTIGNFIDICPNKMLLSAVKRILIPIQLGGEEPFPVFSPTMAEVASYLQAFQEWDQGIGGM